MAERIYIFDTTLRDGEQSPGCSMTVPEKLKMAAKLVDLGVDILEAGFPIASDGDFEAVGAVAREFPWVNVAALARSNKLDVERAAQSLKHAKRPRIHTFIATSDIHLKFKLKKSQQQVLDVAEGYRSRGYPLDVMVVDWVLLDPHGPARHRSGCVSGPESHASVLPGSGLPTGFT